MQARVTTLVDAHIARLAEDGRAVRTLDAYRCDAGELAMFVGGGQVGEALPAQGAYTSARRTPARGNR